MENKKAVFIAALIALVVAGIIVGAIIYLTGLLRNRTVTTPATNVVTSSPGTTIVSGTPNPRPSVTTHPSPAPSVAPTVPANMKIVGIGGYTMTYPNTWGQLKCTNSSNIEFDPYNGTDQTATCDYAAKPITVIVTPQLSCAGETITLGANRVVRVKTPTRSGTDYRWCVYGTGNMNFDITHRVSSSGGRAVSKDDFSSQVEQMISSMRTGGAS